MTRRRSQGGWSQHLRPSLEGLSVYDVPPSNASARLHANECAEPWPPEARRAFAREIEQLELNRYPDTSGRELRAVLARSHRCDPERIVLGNGSDEIISLLLTALSGGSGGHLVIPEPTFVMYRQSAQVLGVEIRGVALDAELQLDEAGLRVALEGAALCFLARPNNPTSGLWDAGLIRALIRDFPATVFVIDEAYIAYAPGQSMWSSDGPENHVHMTTLSKVGLAALRLGYCIATPRLALALNKVRHPYNISQTSLAIATLALTRFGAVQDEMIARTIENRGHLIALLRGVPGGEVFPAHGNLVLLRCGTEAQAAMLMKKTAAAGVRIKDVGQLPGLSRCVRISVGTREEIDRLAAALEAG